MNVLLVDVDSVTGHGAHPAWTRFGRSSLPFPPPATPGALPYHVVFALNADTAHAPEIVAWLGAVGGPLAALLGGVAQTQEVLLLPSFPEAADSALRRYALERTREGEPRHVDELWVLTGDCAFAEDLAARTGRTTVPVAELPGLHRLDGPRYRRRDAAARAREGSLNLAILAEPRSAGAWSTVAPTWHDGGALRALRALTVADEDERRDAASSPVPGPWVDVLRPTCSLSGFLGREGAVSSKLPPALVGPGPARGREGALDDDAWVAANRDRVGPPTRVTLRSTLPHAAYRGSCACLTERAPGERWTLLAEVEPSPHHVSSWWWGDRRTARVKVSDAGLRVSGGGFGVPARTRVLDDAVGLVAALPGRARVEVAEDLPAHHIGRVRDARGAEHAWIAERPARRGEEVEAVPLWQVPDHRWARLAHLPLLVSDPAPRPRLAPLEDAP